MPLTPGTRIGSYEIVAPLGAGGMGEVYRARDPKLGRDVALKVLPASFATDPDRLMRFEREAKALAALNHPNIAAIYEMTSAEGVPLALVMEFVEGDDLAFRISTGAMPIEDALPIARQIAEALEAAHEAGIIHRDLKPANIKIRRDGTVKVLDFGLAKALGPSTPDTTGGASDSGEADTVTSPALTALGLILGTAAYMSPEQARGRPVDRRADIWAFGAVLYEMLTGVRAFRGTDISLTLASVLKDDVKWDALPADLPVPLRRLLRRCLEKDPKNRLGAIGDARLELNEALSPSNLDGASAPISQVASPAWRRGLPWGVALVGVAAAIGLLLAWAPWQSPMAPSPRRLLVSLGADARLIGTASIALSADGKTLVFVGRQSAQGRLFVRKLDELDAVPLEGTEDAASPFLSPNGEWIAYFANGKLRKISVRGGASIDLCEARSFVGGTWVDDETIVFTPGGTGRAARLMRVSSSGGVPNQLGTAPEEATMGSQVWPQALPDAGGILFTLRRSGTDWEESSLAVMPVSGQGAPKIVVNGGYFGRYVPSGSSAASSRDLGRGHILFMRKGTVFAVPFDAAQLETLGDATPVLENVDSNLDTAGVQIASSSEGTLAFVPGGEVLHTDPIEWMTRDGKTTALRSQRADWASPRFSPNGRRLAFEAWDGRRVTIWTHDWVAGRSLQVTFDGIQDRSPVWTPDNSRIVFTSMAAAGVPANLFWVPADGSGRATRLTTSPFTQRPSSWHPRLNLLAFHEDREKTGSDLMLLPFEDADGGLTPRAAVELLATPAREISPMFSPDGRWISYVSDEAAPGKDLDLYVRPSYPGMAGKWRISTGGAKSPTWSRNTNELLFMSRGQVMSVRYSTTGDSFSPERPQLWSPTYLATWPPDTTSSFDIHPDGERLATMPFRELGDKVVLLSNFSHELWRLAPARRSGGQ